jgi:hypothetical protein
MITRLMDVAANSEAAPQVRAVATQALRDLSAMLTASTAAATDVAHRRAARDDIERFLTRPDQPRKQTTPLSSPPGDPIGSKAQPR